MTYSDDAERTVLGAILVDNAALASAAALEPSDFYAPKNRLILSALRKITDRGGVADLVSLRDALGKHLDEAGGAAYLSSLMDGVPRLSNVGHWVRIIQEHAAGRRLLTVAGKLREAVEKGEPPASVIERAIGALIQLARRSDPEGFLDNRQLAREAMREIEEQAAATDGILGWRTGLADLDSKLQGIRPGHLGLIGARLKYGKSILALQIAEAVARQADGRVAVFSREMSGRQLTKRRLSAEAGVSLATLHRAGPEAMGRSMERLARAFEHVIRPDVAIDTRAATIPAMRAKARQLQAEHGLSMVVVDYVQLVEATEAHQRRDQEIKEISGDLKRMAMDLEVPVLAVVQLSRGAEGERPAVHHIAEGDGIARDCDWAILIDRHPKAKKGEEPPGADVAHLILTANRDGLNGVVPVRFNPFVARFENLPRDGQASSPEAAQEMSA